MAISELRFPKVMPRSRSIFIFFALSLGAHHVLSVDNIEDQNVSQMILWPSLECFIVLRENSELPIYISDPYSNVIVLTNKFLLSFSCHRAKNAHQHVDRQLDFDAERREEERKDERKKEVKK